MTGERRTLDEILERVAADPDGPEARALQALAKRTAIIKADFEASMQRLTESLSKVVQRAAQP